MGSDSLNYNSIVQLIFTKGNASNRYRLQQKDNFLDYCDDEDEKNISLKKRTYWILENPYTFKTGDRWFE